MESRTLPNRLTNSTASYEWPFDFYEGYSLYILKASAIHSVIHYAGVFDRVRGFGLWLESADGTVAV